MPTAHISDIIGIHTAPTGDPQDTGAAPAEHPTVPGVASQKEAEHAIDTKARATARRVTGSTDLPLSEKGKQQAEDLAQRTKGQFTAIFAGPKARAQQSADAVHKANPRAKRGTSGGLRPWRLGGLEGKPTDEARPEVHRLMTKDPDEIPAGKGEQSTDEGESFNEAKGRVIGHLLKRLKEHKPGDRTVDFTSGRNIRIEDAYLRGGMRKDGGLDMKPLTQPDESKPGDLFLRDVGRRRLVKVREAKKDGSYVARHAATEWSGESDKGGETGS